MENSNEATIRQLEVDIANLSLELEELRATKTRVCSSNPDVTRKLIDTLQSLTGSLVVDLGSHSDSRQTTVANGDGDHQSRDLLASIKGQVQEQQQEIDRIKMRFDLIELQQKLSSYKYESAIQEMELMKQDVKQLKEQQQSSPDQTDVEEKPILIRVVPLSQICHGQHGSMGEQLEIGKGGLVDLELWQPWKMKSTSTAGDLLRRCHHLLPDEDEIEGAFQLWSRRGDRSLRPKHPSKEAKIGDTTPLRDWLGDWYFEGSDHEHEAVNLLWMDGFDGSEWIIFARVYCPIEGQVTSHMQVKELDW